ncbi:MAG TPA: AI-2E family transporter [Herbaspirillum sp.]|jgi:predicted PurR-regulated permease PerM
MNTPQLHEKTFLALLIVVTIAFGWILLPFYGAVFWGSVLAILFAPFYRRLLVKMNQRRNLAALATLFLVLVIVILPLTFISISIVKEAILIYDSIRSGQINFGLYFQQTVAALPHWAVGLLERFGLNDLAAIQQTLSAGAVQGSQIIAKQALSITQNAFSFLVGFGIMLYLLYFLLRDGSALSARIRHAIPLTPSHKRLLFSKFTTVIRATVKGNIAVAAAQGALGGLIFWILGIEGSLLWGVLMAFLSLLPAIGAALIWGPVAIYFLATGVLWKGFTLIAFCVIVIGLVDNIMRPILVGKDTQMPDYVVLISTLGGMSLFGLNGFVIGPVIAAMFMSVWDLFTTGQHPAGHDRLE